MPINNNSLNKGAACFASLRRAARSSIFLLLLHTRTMSPKSVLEVDVQKFQVNLAGRREAKQAVAPLPTAKYWRPPKLEVGLRERSTAGNLTLYR